jgi:hypothetical protein
MIVWTNMSGRPRQPAAASAIEAGHTGPFYALRSQDGRAERGFAAHCPDLLWGTDPESCIERALRWERGYQTDMGRIEKGGPLFVLDEGRLAEAKARLSQCECGDAMDAEHYDWMTGEEFTTPVIESPETAAARAAVQALQAEYDALAATPDEHFANWDPTRLECRVSPDHEHRHGIAQMLADADYVIGYPPEARQRPAREGREDEVDPFTGLVPVYIVLRRSS